MAERPKHGKPEPFESAEPKRPSISQQTEIGADVPMEPLVSSDDIGVFTPAALQRAVAQNSYTPPLAPSDTGGMVGELQRELRKAGLLPPGRLGDAENFYGAQTEAAVRAFQQANGLEPTGACDTRTRAALRALVRSRGA